MNFGTFSFSRLLAAGLFITFLTIIVTGCDKNDTQAPPPTIPVVTTAALTNITATGATSGGSIVSDGGAAVTQSGIVLSMKNAIPTTADTVIAGTTATGVFTSAITGLEFNRTYYIRAFATNSVGTGYGDVVTLNTTNDDTKVRFTYNGQEVTYGIIISPTTGRKWLDRNLGAQQVATAFDDYFAYGDLFQWGRPADGHQLMNWTSSAAGTPINGTTTTLATSDNPGHSNFIFAHSWDDDNNTKYDWRDDNNRNRWMTTPQGPCPAGWHVPTKDEWEAEISNTIPNGTATSGGMTDGNSAYSLLKLTAAGNRASEGSNAGTLYQIGKSGFYWGSTDHVDRNGFTDGFYIGTGQNFMETYYWFKSGGYSVRCIRDL